MDDDNHHETPQPTIRDDDLISSHSTSSGVDLTSLEIPIAVIACIIYIFTTLTIHAYQQQHGAIWIHETAVIVLVGIVMGGIMKVSTGHVISFDNNLFFYLILPPIIFSAGYSLKRKRFFQHLDLIAFFGIIGTILNFLLIATGAYYYNWIFYLLGLQSSGVFQLSWYEALIFSAVLVGTDDVAAKSLIKMKDFPLMGALIFGEGVVNDALSIVFFHTFFPMYQQQKQQEMTISMHPAIKYPPPAVITMLMQIIEQLVFACAIGCCCALVHARLMKAGGYFMPQNNNMQQFPTSQAALVILFGYFAYCIAEACEVSGIMTIFVAAITMAHYSWYSLASSARITTRIAFAAISEIAEGFSFAYVGLSLWAYENDEMNIFFAIYMLLVLLCARVITVLGTFALCRLCFASFRVSMPTQIGFMLGGFVRGALCWAQILQLTHSPVLVTTTLVLVMVTLIGSGILLPIVLPRIKQLQLSAKLHDATRTTTISDYETRLQPHVHREESIEMTRAQFHPRISDTSNTKGKTIDVEEKELVEDVVNYQRLVDSFRQNTTTSRSLIYDRRAATLSPRRAETVGIAAHSTSSPAFAHGGDDEEENVLPALLQEHKQLLRQRKDQIRQEEEEQQLLFKVTGNFSPRPPPLPSKRSSKLPPLQMPSSITCNASIQSQSPSTQSVEDDLLMTQFLLHHSVEHGEDESVVSPTQIETVAPYSGRARTPTGTREAVSLGRWILQQWLRFDDIAMKPIFGGSDRRMRQVRDGQVREAAMDLMKQVSSTSYPLPDRQQSQTNGNFETRYGSSCSIISSPLGGLPLTPKEKVPTDKLHEKTPLMINMNKLNNSTESIAALGETRNSIGGNDWRRALSFPYLPCSSPLYTALDLNETREEELVMESVAKEIYQKEESDAVEEAAAEVYAAIVAEDSTATEHDVERGVSS